VGPLYRVEIDISAASKVIRKITLIVSIRIKFIGEIWQEIKTYKVSNKFEHHLSANIYSSEKNYASFAHLFSNISVIRKMNKTTCLSVSEANDLAFTTQLAIPFHGNLVPLLTCNFFNYFFESNLSPLLAKFALNGISSNHLQPVNIIECYLL